MRFGLLIAAAALVGVGASACATKGYVNTQTAEVNARIEDLTRVVEETQDRVRQNETKIGETDEKAAAAGQSAQRAQTTAEEAGNLADQAVARIDDLDRAVRRLVYEVVLADDRTQFGFGQTDLGQASRAELDGLIAKIKAERRAVWFEIEGHTDSAGSPDVNQRVGLRRAEAVMQYLHRQHQVPLHKINVISYGEERPVAPNTTPAGRARNRRVVVRVLS
jgi:outer membrane protein OmpA-like peptidoglycan-associated protein